MAYYFWYSKKQEHRTCGILINGKWVKYTECSEKSRPAGEWSDYKLVFKSNGVGFPWERIKIDGKWQQHKYQDFGLCTYRDYRASGLTRLEAVLKLKEAHDG